MKLIVDKECSSKETTCSITLV